MPLESYRGEVEQLRSQIRPGTLTADDLTRLAETWAPRVRPSGKDWNEAFEVTRPDGTTTGVTGPRWLFHLLGIPHRGVFVGLDTPGGLILLQRRSPEKADNPDTWDVAVSGHVSEEPGTAGGSTYFQAALRELEEELGLTGAVDRKRREAGDPSLDVRCFLVDRELTPVGAPRADPREPTSRWWFCNIEVRQMFVATLTPEALAEVRLQPEEVAGIYLCPPAEARRILDQEAEYRRQTGQCGRFMSPGGFLSLPYYLDWLPHRR